MITSFWVTDWDHSGSADPLAVGGVLKAAFCDPAQPLEGYVAGFNGFPLGMVLPVRVKMFVPGLSFCNHW